MLFFYLIPVFMGIAFLASLTLFFQRDTEPYLKLFPFFLLLTLTVEIIGATMVLHIKNNLILSNPFTVLAICFYLFILHQFTHSRKVRKIILYLICIYPAVAFFNIFFIQKMVVFHTMTYSLGCLLIVALCIYYFFELFQLTHTTNLLRQPSFWICSGLLFYFSCSFPLYGLNNLVTKTASPQTIRNLIFVFNLLDVFLYSSFTIAFLCRLRIRKST